MKTVVINQDVVPNRIVFQNKVFKITNLPDYFIIKKPEIIYNDKTHSIKYINIGLSHHPNSSNRENIIPPQKLRSKSEWCISNYFKDMNFTDERIPEIIKALKTWNYNSCYWKSWTLISYEEMELKSDVFKTIYPPSKFDLFIMNIFKIPNKTKQLISSRFRI